MPFTRVQRTAQTYCYVKRLCCGRENPAYNCNTIIGEENGAIGGAIINVPAIEKFDPLDSILEDNLQTTYHIVFQGQVKSCTEIFTKHK